MGFGLSDILVPFAGSKKDIYGSKPEVPDYPTLEKAQQDAIAHNKSVLPDITEIGSKVNEFSQSQLEQMLRQAIPGLDDINAKASSNIQSMLSGALPDDVKTLIERKSAENATAGGFSGSGVHRNLTARDLGLASLQLTQTGLSSAERWIANAKATQTAPLFDVTSMFVSPAQQFASAEGKFQRDVYAANVAAAPDPVARGQFDSDMAIIGMVLSAYGGGAGYTGQYKGMSSPDGNGGGAGSDPYAVNGAAGRYIPSYVPSYSNSAGEPTATPQGSSDYKFSLF